MQKYTLHIGLYNTPMLDPGGDEDYIDAEPVYLAREVDAQIAQLTAEIAGKEEIIDQRNKICSRYFADISLLKAALRWCLENGASATRARGWFGCPVRGEMELRECRPDLAAVIAEATKS